HRKERRKHNWNRWSVHATCPENNFRTDYSHYGQSLGLGYYEYFRLAEYLGAKPLPVVSVGIACQYMSTEVVPLGSGELETYIQEALDVVEFANGGADTVWGRVRAEMGHPEPFGLEYLGVGNEQWETETTKERKGNEFYKRFELFERRIHEKYPHLKIVGTVGPTVDSDSHKSAWKWTRENLKKNPNFVYCSDEHFYVSPEWLYKNVNVYDKYPRDGGLVYAGEYAAHVPGSGCALFNAPQANVWEGALAEAAFMTGMERNADIVVMKSYAPLFARLGYTQWSPDLIWFNGKTAYGSPSYYVQLLYSRYTGDWSLKAKADAKDVYVSATEREAFTYVKVVNAGAEEIEATAEGDYDFGSLTRIVRLSGALSDYNTAEEPFKITPEEVAPTQAHTLTLAPHSFNVLIFKK
ncbi:MAG: alpha-L-arabinofuranosidase, partial [Clostridia bacterium]|nr:alpha-L-arabinofuranosidase [Clostridia bacterium]